MIWIERSAARGSRDGVRRGQDGQVLVLFALGIFVLFAAVALGIDGSRTFEERRSAQIAADHAATAAAYASCAGGDLATAQTAGRASALANGYDDTSPAVAVAIDEVAPYTFRAGVTSTIDGTFARVIEINNFTVSVEATAAGLDCGAVLAETSGVGPGAIFAGGTCPSGEYALDVSGSTDYVFGGVHANDDVRVGGSSNDFDEPSPAEDPFTYVGSMDQGSGNFYETPPYPMAVAAQPWPAGFDPSVASLDVSNDPYWTVWRDKAIADGHGGSLLTSKITTIPSNGVYYTSNGDGMDIGSINSSVTSFTLIARNGPIKISASSRTFDPDADGNGILMLSGMVKPADKKCSEYTVALSGSSSDWNGIIWAPGGLIEFSGSDNSAVNGSLIGWAVRLNGSNLEVRYVPDASETASTNQPTVVLVK